MSAGTDAVLSARQRRQAMVVVGLGVMVSVSTGVMLPVALPAVARALELSADSAVAVVSVYQIVVLVSLLPFASLGTRFGDRRIFCAGLVVFAVGSLLAALSPAAGWLMASRVVQGLGAAAVSSITPALVRSFYPAERLGEGMGLTTLAVAGTAAAAPLLASALLAAGDWPWLFLVMVPVCVLAFGLALRWVPRSPAQRRPVDAGSALLNVAGFGLLMVGIDALGREATRDRALLELVAALMFIIWLLHRQIQAVAPMLPLDLLRRPAFAFAVATAALAFATQMLAFVSVPFLLRDFVGGDPVRVALCMAPWPVASAVVAPFAGRLSDRLPSGWLGLAGLGTVAGGLALLASVPADGRLIDLLWRLALCGAGFAFFQPPNNRAIMLGAPAPRSNAASGMLAFARLFGQTSGAALAGLYFGLGGAEAARTGLWLGAGLAVAAALVSGLRPRRRAGHGREARP